MKKKKILFGKNIPVSCEYCQFSLKNGETFLCCKKKQIVHGKCGKYAYNPTLRKPGVKTPATQSVIAPQTFTIDDFVL